MARLKPSSRTDSAGPLATNPGVRQMVLCAAALIAITLLAYMGVAKAQFISFDDPSYVTGNYHVLQGLTWTGAKWAMTSFDASNWHPLTWLSHMLDVELFGKEPVGHHLVNLAFHIANMVLLLLLLTRMTSRLWPSAFAAAIFAIHPLHVESVAWVAERKDVLSTFFWLLTMLAYAYYARKPSLRRYALTLALFVMGLMAKPMIVTLPLVLLLIDYWPLQRKVPFRKLIVEKLPLAIVALASCMLTVAAQKHAMFAPAGKVTILTLTNAVVSYGVYMWQMFWPAGLAPHHPMPLQPMFLAAGAVGACLASMTMLAFRYRAKYPYVFTGWVWYLITLLPVIGILQVGDQAHAERYTYIPLVGLFIVVAFAASNIAAKTPQLRTAFIVLAAVILMASAAVTKSNVAYWHDNYTLFSHAAAVEPESSKIQTSLGASLWRMGRLDEAIGYLQRAIYTGRYDGSVFTVLGRVYIDKGDAATAMRYFGEAAKDPREAFEAEYGMGGALFETRDYDGGVSHLRRAAQVDPYSAKAQSILAMALAEMGRRGEASEALARAESLDAADALSLYAKGYVLALNGDLAAAAEAYRRSLAAERNELVQKQLASVLERQGLRKEAMEEYKKVLAIDPGDAIARAAYERLSVPR